MRIVLGFFFFIIPLHAFLVTLFKCKYGFDVDFTRFWKELIIMGLFIIVCFTELSRNHYSLKKIYKDNYLLGTITAFTFCSLFYMWFPFMEIKMASILGFRYDVVFLLALVVGLYLYNGKKDMTFYMKTLFISTFGILIVFLPWYIF